MGFKALLSKPIAAILAAQTKSWSMHPEKTQKRVFEELITKAARTQFGKEHGFESIKTYQEYQQRVPLRDYEGFRPYIERITKGESNVLWPKKPIYFCKTSGTTSGVKYIPITGDSIHNHIDSARNALLSYIHETGNASFLDGNLIFLSGSPVLGDIGGIPLGRLSGIVNHHVPAYLRRNQMPSFTTNCIEDWEEKVQKIAVETQDKPMTLISGIPSWVQMYFEVLQQQCEGKSIKEIFPHFSLFVYGGVNYEPYKARFENLIGKPVDSLELFPASEGFFAYQDKHPSEGLLLLLNSGIFYEFVPLDELEKSHPKRLTIDEVELGVNYALILTTNAGLWAYNIGDTIKFVSKYPHRIIVSGRVKHFISAFGEHVIAEEVERALNEAVFGDVAEIVEFTVAPCVAPDSGLPYHEWFIEFNKMPSDPDAFRLKIDKALQQKNIYYKDLIQGNVLRPLVMQCVSKDAFVHYMKQEGKLGGQNKVPRLSNDRKLADGLQAFVTDSYGA